MTFPKALLSFRNNSLAVLPVLILVFTLTTQSTVRAFSVSVHASFKNSPKLPSPQSTTNKVVAAAYSLRGTRYRFGGTSRSGFDCSGFVRYVLSTTGGIALPRTATDQYYHGQAIARKDLEPGDLVFFRNTYRYGISHVGIYTGNGRFVHASNPRTGVVESSLNESYYANHYAGARRVMPALLRGTADGRW